MISYEIIQWKNSLVERRVPYLSNKHLIYGFHATRSLRYKINAERKIVWEIYFGQEAKLYV